MRNWFKPKASTTIAASDLLADARAHLKAGEFGLAASSYRKVLEETPADASAWVSLGYVLRRLGTLEDATEALARAQALAPERGDVHYMLGEALLASGNASAALPHLEKATQLAPELVFAHVDRIQACVQNGDLAAALDAARHGLTINPEAAPIYTALGHVHALRHDPEDARQAYARAVQFAPSDAMARIGLGVALQRVGEHQGGLEHLRQAVELAPEDALARFSFAMGHLPLLVRTEGELGQGDAAFVRALAAFDAWSESHAFDESVVVAQIVPFVLAYREENHRDMLMHYGALCAKLMARWRARQSFAAPRPRALEGRIRLGIASPHFSNHSVWHALIRGWLEEIDRSRFEVHGFHLSRTVDAETERAKRHLDAYVAAPASVAQWVEAIEQANLDVLIYPGIGLDGLSSQLASLRMAPLQAVGWGHPETTGLPTLDYYISAELFEPENAQENYSETLLSLPHLGSCYRPFITAGQPPDLKALGIDPLAPLLICPGTPFKYAPEHDGVLIEIARRLRQCRLVFFRKGEDALADQLERRLAGAFARAGLNASAHVSFIPWLSPPAFHGLMKRATVFLDTIGFSGFNTAIQAIECGLPVVTREGRYMRGRLASGILRGLGMHQLIARDEAEYVDKVVRLVSDDTFRDEVQRAISRASPDLFGDLAPIRALEDLLEHAVRNNRAGAKA
jgi:predicted O-linked N-acetylglucosamine transferase (SPINDLY family)